jgi:hypothetical protein
MARITVNYSHVMKLGDHFHVCEKFLKQPCNKTLLAAGISRHECGSAGRWCSCRVWALWDVSAFGVTSLGTFYIFPTVVNFTNV